MQQIVDSGTSERPRSSTGTAIEEALAGFAADAASSGAALRALNKRDPLEFGRAAALVLSSAETSPGLKLVAELAVGGGLMADILVLQDEIPVSTAVAATKGLSVADPLFVVRMIRKVIQDYGEVGAIPPPIALRLLQILDETSDSSRLTNHLIQFVRHPSQHVRSKSVLLMGRGNLNLNRTREYLSSPVPRVRANAVESIWDQPDASIKKALQECSKDSNQRVAVNALVGLCRLGDAEAAARLAGMAKSENPVARAGAAWGMGNVNRSELVAEFKVVLEGLVEDAEPRVRDMARKSLEGMPAQDAAERD